MKQTLTTVLAWLVASVTSLASAQELQGDAKAAQGKIAMCIGCHSIVGYRTSFPEVYQVPKISGQNAAYIEAALHAYKTGERKHPTMRAITDSLTAQDIADVAAFYAQDGAATVKAIDKPSKEPNAQVAELLQKGACTSCHGESFSKGIDPSYPKLAGQNADYLYAALKAYTVENNTLIGRSNPVMGAMARQFNHSEMKALANYLGSLDGELQTVPEPRFR